MIPTDNTTTITQEQFENVPLKDILLHVLSCWSFAQRKKIHVNTNGHQHSFSAVFESVKWDLIDQLEAFTKACLKLRKVGAQCPCKMCRNTRNTDK